MERYLIVFIRQFVFLACCFLVKPSLAQTIDLTQLNGSNGYATSDLSPGDLGGFSVAAVDLNGDGFDELILGAPLADPDPGRIDAGQVYVIYGRASGFPASVDLAALNGANGFIINGGTANDEVGFSVNPAGDLNNDGLDDLVIGAPRVLSSPTTNPAVGQAFIIFGRSTPFPTPFELTTLDGENGFRITAATTAGLGGMLGAIGDINNDSLDDLALAAPNSGVVFVIFGSTNPFPSTMDASQLDGSNGFRINSTGSHQLFGSAITGLDISGDGINDLAIGAPGNLTSDIQTGQVFIIYGRAGFPAFIDTRDLDSLSGLVIQGDTLGDATGFALTQGDINHDGRADLVVGSPGFDSPLTRSGRVSVIYGHVPRSTGFNLASLDGSNGFHLNGTEAGGSTGTGLSIARDLNADGVNDLLVGAPREDGDNTANAFNGVVYVVYGNPAGFPLNQDLSQISPDAGAIIHGLSPLDNLGGSVSAGDINGDGGSDLLLGASQFDGIRRGRAYVSFGQDVANSDLSININNGLDAIQPGQTVTYTITAQNNGPDDINAAQITGTMPAALLDVATATWTCQGVAGGVCGTANGLGNVALTVDLPVAAEVSIQLQVSVIGNIGSVIQNRVNISLPIPAYDDQPANNSAIDMDIIGDDGTLSLGFETYLKAENPDEIDEFGIVVAASGNTLVVGVPRDDSAASGINGNSNDDSLFDSGAVYVYQRIGAEWQQQAYIKASNPGSGDLFGSALAISGDTLIVGTAAEDSAATGINGNQNDNSANGAGAAYVFVRNGSTWAQQAYLKASNTGAGDAFGQAVSIDGDTAVVTALSEDSTAANSGAAYVFVRNAGTWNQQALLKASNASGNNQFGISTGISGNTIVVGASQERSLSTGVNGNQSQSNDPNVLAGAAYVFVRSGNTWSQQAYLKASNTGNRDQFGFSTAISGETIVVGAVLESSNAIGVNGNQNNDASFSSGATYVFQRSGSQWAQQAYLKASNTRGDRARFGEALSLDGDTLIVGARFESGGDGGVNADQNDTSAPGAGAAYVFVRSAGQWSQRAYLKSIDPDMSDDFGQSVAVSDNNFLVGARREDSNASGINGNANDNSLSASGAAFIFGATNYSIGGNVSGLAPGNRLIIQNNAGSDLIIQQNGPYQFASRLVSGSTYQVTVLDQPSTPNQLCSVTQANGTVFINNITNIDIECVTLSYSIGGTVNGLAGSGLVLSNNGSDKRLISTNGSFTFNLPVQDASAYSVSVIAQPSGLSQTCSVTNASGLVRGGVVNNIEVNCVSNRFTIGGSVNGLVGSGLILQINGGDTLQLTDNGTFIFTQPLSDGSLFNVRVLSQPDAPDQFCQVFNGNGRLDGQTVDTVVVSCAFAANLAITMSNGTGFFEQFDDTTYIIRVSNPSSNTVFAAEVISLIPPELDVATATWTCQASSGALCSGAGNGDINDLVDLPAGGLLTYFLNTTVLATSNETVTNTAMVIPPASPVDADLSNNLTTDTDIVALFADGFEDSQ